MRQVLAVATASVILLAGCRAVDPLSPASPDQPSSSPVVAASPQPPRPPAVPAVSPLPVRSPSPQVPAPPPPRTLEREGVRVTLTLDRHTYAPGEIVWAHVRVENTNAHPVIWRAGGCGYPATAAASVPGLQRPGRDWPGALGAYKQQVLEGHRSWGRTGFMEQQALLRVLGRGSGTACPAVALEERLAAGGVLEVTLGWDGGLVSPFAPDLDRVRAPEGPVTVVASFPLGGFEDPSSIEVATTVELTGGPPALVSPGEAVDTALAEPRFARWLAPRLGGEGYFVSGLSFGNGHWVLGGGHKWTSDDEPPAWFYPNEAAVVIEPTSGTVVEVRLQTSGLQP